MSGEKRRFSSRNSTQHNAYVGPVPIFTICPRKVFPFLIMSNPPFENVYRLSGGYHDLAKSRSLDSCLGWKSRFGARLTKEITTPDWVPLTDSLLYPSHLTILLGPVSALSPYLTRPKF
ncbi:hypothetical protein K443DRAFT_683486 [Laccaria amethystina LaAM-08-1]|uniref:Uncharacterized protein n=1 Tax=Laccaria amethystina LaAM-08-1 TaxID=1095629 RepID=A0A0C9X0G9_9AGAR|nr:hypothetical protein K443DRAFT_683486 [Laccaria amethystina LaAM-08-1]